jgi:hypothetical protein
VEPNLRKENDAVSRLRWRITGYPQKYHWGLTTPMEQKNTNNSEKIKTPLKVICIVSLISVDEDVVRTK